MAPLFRRELPPADYRNHDADQHRDRTTDGPGHGVAHRATTKHSESLERPDQTEHRDDQPDRECNDESPSHIGDPTPDLPNDFSTPAVSDLLTEPTSGPGWDACGANRSLEQELTATW